MLGMLKWVANRSFVDGQRSCNELGKTLVKGEGVERMLDVGCGDGELTMEFATAAGARQVHGIELVDEAAKKAEGRGIRVVRADLNGKWKLRDGYFDLVISSQNIEHLHNTRLYLEECHRCLKPGGRLVILTENLASWVNIGALVFGWQPFSTTNMCGWSLGNPCIWHADEAKDEVFFERWQAAGASGAVGHLRVLAYRGLFDLLRKTSFEEVKVHTRGYLPLWGPLAGLLCRLDRRHGHFLVGTGRKP